MIMIRKTQINPPTGDDTHIHTVCSEMIAFRYFDARERQKKLSVLYVACNDIVRRDGFNNLVRVWIICQGLISEADLRNVLYGIKRSLLQLLSSVHCLKFNVYHEFAELLKII